jgi:hypothetical protein
MVDGHRVNAITDNQRPRSSVKAAKHCLFGRAPQDSACCGTLSMPGSTMSSTYGNEDRK